MANSTSDKGERTKVSRAASGRPVATGGRRYASRCRAPDSLETSIRSPHRTFKRSYREDYVRDLEVPGMAYHVFHSFRLIFKNWKIFLPLVLIMIVLAVFLIGVADEYLNGETMVFGGLIFLMIWLITIFVIRHKMAGNKIGIRDALYNSMSPLLSSFVVLIVAAIQTLPIMVLVVAYSSAVETHFLDTSFYAFLFLGFAGLMLLLSGYLLSSSLIALVAVSAPGMYPMEALKTASEVMAGRRIKFVLRLILLLILVVVMWVVVMYPISAFDSFMYQYEWTRGVPMVKICGIMTACFISVYISVYLYIYYRWILKFDTKEVNEKKRSRRKN